MNSVILTTKLKIDVLKAKNIMNWVSLDYNVRFTKKRILKCDLLFIYINKQGICAKGKFLDIGKDLKIEIINYLDGYINYKDLVKFNILDKKDKLQGSLRYLDEIKTSKLLKIFK